MGIDGLWELLEPAAQVYSLNDISLMNGYSASKKNNITRVGVDISVVMNECISASQNSHLYRYKTSNEFRIFFFKLCRFLREAPCIMIFVFDGPSRPSFKHGRHIDTHTVPEWVNRCKTIIEAFGFYWHQAPGEAEAELAMLSRCDAIDVVMTNDSDALVFGAQCVIKSIKYSLAPEKYLLYSMDVVENMVGLSHGGLLLVALLSKSDYSNGLAGCGPNISASLARCGFGDQILRAVEKLEDFKLHRELERIAVDIQNELRNNSSNLLHSCYPNLASNFSVDLIAPDKVLAFLDPIISTGSPSPSLLPPTIPTWIIKEPSIPQISQFCAQTLNWADSALEKSLAGNLWPGVLLRIFTSPLLVCNDNAKKLYVTPHTQTEIYKTSLFGERKKKLGRWAKVQFSINNFRALMGITLKRTTEPDMYTWICADYLPDNLIPTPIIQDHGHSPHAVPPCASTSLDAAPADESMDLDQVITPEFTASESPDPPSIMDLLNSVSGIHNSHQLSSGQTNTASVSKVLEITDSESDVEIVRGPHKRMRSFSPEVIVISD